MKRRPPKRQLFSRSGQNIAEHTIFYSETVSFFRANKVDVPRNIRLPDGKTLLSSRPFTSTGCNLLPDLSEGTVLDKISAGFDAIKERLFYKEIDHILHIDDSKVKENTTFRYPLFLPEGNEAPGAIFLLHGLNEKQWDKYLPWAYELCLKTGYAVLLFP